jgi:tRNA nucleotidyltransferase (CCA-adding enzyme)
VRRSLPGPASGSITTSAAYDGRRDVPALITLPPILDSAVKLLHDAGYRAFVVGGAVRDALLGHQPKDIDIEVYGISYDKLAVLLANLGRIDLVGKSFGIVKLASDGQMYDFCVPRRDSKIGLHHRDFRATFDENITPEEAASRRDFTINAMSWDPVSGEVLDFFHGREDLRNHVLRATSSAFSEDPLRVLRGMQFACRFDLTLDPATADLCRTIADQYGTIARERVADEFMKWAVKSTRPGRIFEYLRESGWSVHFPELARLQGVPQDPEWHPEGDVQIHTALVLDAAARIAERDGLEGDDRAVLLFGALCHDLAKATTTVLRERGGRLRWTSFGHEQDGVPMARAFLTRIGIKAAIIEQVEPLVENHMIASSIGREPSERAVRRLAQRLYPATIAQLLRVIEADYSGRPPLPQGLPESAVRIKELADAQAVCQGPPAPLLLGRHVLPYFGGTPGPHIGRVTAAAYEAQLDGEFSTEDEARAWLEAYMSAGLGSQEMRSLNRR